LCRGSKPLGKGDRGGRITTQGTQIGFDLLGGGIFDALLVFERNEQLGNKRLTDGHDQLSA
jgi:hypothetical protein